MSNGGDPRLNLWAIILMSTCGVMFVAFFMPWWGMTQKITGPPKRPQGFDAETRKAYQEALKERQDKRAKVVKVLRRNSSWYRNKIGDDRLEDFQSTLSDGAKDSSDGGSFQATLRLWGWNTGIGITAFVFSLVLLPVAIVPMFVQLLRSWIWIGYFVVAVSGLVLFILSLVWYFSSPGENVSGQLWQGVGWYPGPYLEILGSLATLAVGVLGGVFGLLSFLKGLKGGGENPRTRPKPRPETDFIENDEF
jgi:hypothetical protein